MSIAREIAAAADAVPVVPWPQFLDGLTWRQGEPVSLVGPTGSGKTTLVLGLLPKREYVTVLGTKPKDPTLDRLERSDGYERIRTWGDRRPLSDLDRGRRQVLWPEYREMVDVAKHPHVFREAIHGMFAQGSWCIVADETFWLVETLGLGPELKQVWMQGRSLGLSLVAGTQRPAWVPLEMYSQATHVFFWRTSDARDLDRIGGLGAHDPKTIRAVVRNLRKHEALYVNTRTGELARTRAPER